MGWDGTGGFDRLYDWETDKAGGIKIRADRMDGEFDNYATGLENCITRNGENSPSANLPMGTKRHTGVGNAAAVNDYAAAGQVVKNSLQWGGASSGGTDAYAVNLTISPGSYTDGLRVGIEADVANTGACTLNLNSLGAKDIKLIDGTDPSSNQIGAGGYHEFIFDLTSDHFVLLNPYNANSEKTARVFAQSTDTAVQITSTWFQIETVGVGNRTRVTRNAGGHTSLFGTYNNNAVSNANTGFTVVTSTDIDNNSGDLTTIMLRDHVNHYHLELFVHSPAVGFHICMVARWNE